MMDCAKGSGRVDSVRGKVVYSSLEFVHILPPAAQPQDLPDNEQQQVIWNEKFGGLTPLKRLHESWGH